MLSDARKVIDDRSEVISSRKTLERADNVLTKSSEIPLEDPYNQIPVNKDPLRSQTFNGIVEENEEIIDNNSDLHSVLNPNSLTPKPPVPKSNSASLINKNTLLKKKTKKIDYKKQLKEIEKKVLKDKHIEEERRRQIEEHIKKVEKEREDMTAASLMMQQENLLHEIR